MAEAWDERMLHWLSQHLAAKLELTTGGSAPDPLAGHLQQVEKRAFEADQCISKEGSPPTEAFYICSGIAQVIVERKGGAGAGGPAAQPHEVIAEVGQGELLGELAIIAGEPLRLSSTFAKTRVEAYAVPLALLESAINHDAALGSRIRRAAEAKMAAWHAARGVSRALRRSLAMNCRLALEDLPELPEEVAIERRAFLDGSFLTRQGEEAGEALFVAAGRVRLLAAPGVEIGARAPEGCAAASMEEVGWVEEGGFVGEIAILTQRPTRLVSAVADGPVEAVVLPREELQRMVVRSPGAGRALVEAAEGKHAMQQDALRVGRCLQRTLAFNLRLALEDLPFLSCDALVERRSYHKGGLVSREGTEAKEAYFILEGKVSLLVAGGAAMSASEAEAMPLEKMAAVGAEAAGGFVGEIAILTGEVRRIVTAVATEPTTVLVIPRTDLEDMMARSPGAGAGLRAAAGRKAEARIQALDASKQLRRALATKLDVDIFDVPELPISVAEDLEEVRFSAGALVTRQGDDATCAYMVKRGEVALVLDITTGEEVESERVMEGGFVGEISILQGNNVRTCSARAVQDVVLLAIPREKLLEVVQCNPDLGLSLKVQANAKWLKQASLSRSSSSNSRGSAERMVMGRTSSTNSRGSVERMVTGRTSSTNSRGSAEMISVSTKISIPTIRSPPSRTNSNAACLAFVLDDLGAEGGGEGAKNCAGGQ